MTHQICLTLFVIWTTLLTRFKTWKSCKAGVNHNITRVAIAYSGSPYMMSRTWWRHQAVAGIRLFWGAYTSKRSIMFFHSRSTQNFWYIISFRTFLSTHVFNPILRSLTSSETCDGFGKEYTWVDQKVLKLVAYLFKYTKELYQTYTDNEATIF